MLRAEKRDAVNVRSQRSLASPLAALAVALWNCWQLRATLTSAQYLDDASMHEQMVRSASAAISHGQLPLTRWFPYLGLGSPQFLHYQSLGSMITGAAGVVVGPETAFRWSLFLLLGFWPLAVYASVRISGADGVAALAAAACAPLLSSVPAVGLEQRAYVWIGYGLWAQLWASWLLPFSWATTWRAMGDRHFTGIAAICVAATIALHFETGYLALAAIPIAALLAHGPVGTRFRRGALVVTGAFAMAAWVLVPLVVMTPWAAINSVLAPTGLVRGYGAGQDLAWLVSGGLFDAGRLPVLTIAVLTGLVVCIAQWRDVPRVRLAAALFVGSLLLSFGPTTWRAAVDFIPGHGDLFFRRFLSGVHLAGLLLIGELTSFLYRGARSVLWGTVAANAGPRWTLVAGRALGIGVCAVGFAWLSPAWIQLHGQDSWNAATVARQHSLELRQSQKIDPLVRYILSHDSGRVFAGSPRDWGKDFDVGLVPVFKFLESRDVQEVGYTLRTASLMTDPEYYFDEYEPSDYRVFAVSYIIVPSGTRPPVPAARIMSAGPYSLWRVPGASYFGVVDTVGTVKADRRTVGPVSKPLLRSDLLVRHEELTVAWAGRRAAKPTAESSVTGAPGAVTAETADLAQGFATARVRLARRAVVMFSASFDPGWTVSVDGKQASTQMLDPAVLGVLVPQGSHVVSFRYSGFSWYPWLLALGALIPVALAGIHLTRRMPGRAGHPRSPSP